LLSNRINKQIIKHLKFKAMKKSIKLTVLALFLSAGICAAAPRAHAGNMPVSNNYNIVFYTLPSQQGIDLRVKKSIPGIKTVVMIRDQDGHLLWRDEMKGKMDIRRGYNLTQLDEGDYSIEITTGSAVFKRNIHIYNEGSKRSFIVEQV
jgi:hypothetical protein